MPCERRYWEPISTAPRDGTEIIVAGGGEVWTDWWDAGWVKAEGRVPAHWIAKKKNDEQVH